MLYEEQFKNFLPRKVYFLNQQKSERSKREKQLFEMQTISKYLTFRNFKIQDKNGTGLTDVLLGRQRDQNKAPKVIAGHHVSHMPTKQYFTIAGLPDILLVRITNNEVHFETNMLS